MSNTAERYNTPDVQSLDAAPFWLIGKLPEFIPKETPPVNPVVEQLYRNPLLRELAGDNKKNASFSPYGYLYDPESMCMMKPDPETAFIVQGIFQMYLAGIETNRIARFLTSHKIPTPRQRRARFGYQYKQPRVNDYWSSVSVRNILKNSVYIGDHVYRLPKLARGIQKQALAELIIPSGSVIHHHHEPLVSDADFESAGILLRLQEQAFRERKAKAAASGTEPQKSLFGSHVFCSVCGRTMIHIYGNHYNPERIQPGYVCSSSLKKLPDACPRILHPTADIIHGATAAIQKERDLAISTSKQFAGGISSPAYLAANRKIASQMAELLDEARAAKTGITSPAAEPEKLQDRFSSLMGEKKALFNTFTTPNKWLDAFSVLPDDFVLDRALTKRLVEKIEISEDGTCKITLARQKEKAALMRYLPQPASE